jgi:hypothetical protein
MGKIDDEIYNNNKKKKINPSILVLGFIFFLNAFQMLLYLPFRHSFQTNERKLGYHYK